MTGETPGVDSFMVVNVERENDEVSRIVSVLEPLGIPVELVGRGRQLRRAPSVVFRVPHARVAEAILALELQGFADVLAYQLEEGGGAAQTDFVSGSRLWPGARG